MLMESRGDLDLRHEPQALKDSWTFNPFMGGSSWSWSRRVICDFTRRRLLNAERGSGPSHRKCLQAWLSKSSTERPRIRYRMSSENCA